MAWQPLTFGGVAAFACASWTRLWLVQILVAAVSALCFACLLLLGVIPVLDQAVERLPEKAEIAEGQLRWTGRETERLAEGPLLSIQVDLEASSQLGQTSDILVQLSKNHWKIVTIFGHITGNYLASGSIDLGQAVIQPRWDTWKPFVCVGLSLFWMLLLVLIWHLLALLYAPVVSLLATLMQRQTGGSTCLKLAAAALLPGALFLSMSLVLFAIRQLELVGFLVSTGLHLGVGWIYLLVAPTCLPADPGLASPSSNPFKPKDLVDAAPPASKNPFRH
ncbi:MAG TPA: hypothetical protein P5186_15610 [Candidatus Paceibacterota bacterium]|nr:hypothetical protein [Verrucomicrobiota bacterium]HRY49477.1 hypothetical protein [Candidatus Paceibacterota bacterium]HRZ99316.1 hypothetical protein [Candidatus Paceibacterota bacterium]